MAINCKVFLLNRLINQEFPKAYRQIVSRLEGEEFVVEDVQQSFVAVKSQSGKLDFVKSNMAQHPLTNTIAILRDLRHQHLLSLRGRVVYCLKSPIVAEREAASELIVWLNRESDYLRSRSIQHQSQSVYRLAHDVSLSSQLQSALESLGLLGVMDSLSSISTQIDEFHSLRKDDQLAITIKNNELRLNAYAAIQTFVIAVEQTIALKKGDVADHQRYIREVNATVSEFYKLHLARSTRRKNAAEAAANKVEDPENGAQTNGGMQPMGGKPAMAGRSKIPNVMTMGGMDLQNGGAPLNGGTQKSAVAMNGSSINGGATNGVDKETDDPSAGNGGVKNDVSEPISRDSATDGHIDAKVNDSSDQVS